jgi:hypothetical protein
VLLFNLLFNTRASGTFRHIREMDMRMMKAGLFAALMAGASPAISETTIVFNNFLARTIPCGPML